MKPSLKWTSKELQRVVHSCVENGTLVNGQLEVEFESTQIPPKRKTWLHWLAPLCYLWTLIQRLVTHIKNHTQTHSHNLHTHTERERERDTHTETHVNPHKRLFQNIQHLLKTPPMITQHIPIQVHVYWLEHKCHTNPPPLPFSCVNSHSLSLSLML